MPTTDDLKLAVGCLSTVFPQFVAKELATLTDQLASAVQGITDPLAAAGALNLDSLIENVAEISELDMYGAMTGVAVGLGGQYAKREISEHIAAMATEYPGVTKRIQQMRNLAGQVQTTFGMAASLFPDMPYAAAQRMCQTIIEADDLKIANLTCMRKHIVQLVNAVLVLAKTGSTVKSGAMVDLAKAQVYLESAQADLTKSQRLAGGSVVFDSQAFERARTSVSNASSLLAPARGGTTIMDLVDIASYGSVDVAHLTRSNQQLVLLVLPSLMALIEAEVGAVMSQVTVINFYVQALGNVIAEFRTIGQASQIQAQRSRAIREIQDRLADLLERIDLAIRRGSLRAASAEMLLWTSRVKAILVTMDNVKDLTLQEGSIEGPDKAFLLQQEFQLLLTDLTGIHDDLQVTVAGIEDPIALRDQVFALTKGARRLLADIENDRVDDAHLANFHALSIATATGQTNRIDRSSTIASQQKVICQRFADIELGFSARYDEMLNSLRFLGLDRGVDMLNSGAFSSFHGVDVNMLSYVGTAIECLKHGIQGTDDQQTKKQLDKMRSDLIAKRTNSEIASADSADSGRLAKLISKARGQIATIQKNAKTVESIVADLKGLLTAANGAIDTSLSGISQFNALLGNVDQLAVGAGGRLAAGLEEFSDHPKGGVVACDLP